MPRLPHQLARERGEIGHDWVSQGKRVEASPVERLKEKVAAEVELDLARERDDKPRVFITVVPTPDLALRRFLVERGVLTESDLAALKARDVSPQIPRDVL